MYPAKVRMDAQAAVSRLSGRKKFCTKADMRAMRHFVTFLFTAIHVPLAYHRRCPRDPKIPRLTSAADAAYWMYVRDLHSHLGAVHKLGAKRRSSLSPKGTRKRRS
jgi:hypothetical protein